MSGKIITADTSVEDLAAIVFEHLDNNGITAVLSGGSVVTIYTGANVYESRDLDFVSPDEHKKILEVMSEIGFTPITENNKNLGHAKTDITVEFPRGPVNFGGAPVRYEDIGLEEVAGKKVRMLSPTQSVMDRLLHYLSSGRDVQGLEQAQWICERYPVDYEKIKKWAKTDGLANDEQFARICKYCEKGISVFLSKKS